MSIINTTSAGEMISDSESRSDDNRLLFMFVRRDDGRYIIYKLDAPRSLEKLSTSVELVPLLVFKYGVIPSCECDFVYIDPYLYIVGQNKNSIFTLHKNRLLALKPSERERGGSLLTRTPPMLDHKQKSIAFDYENNLYVISAGTQHYYEFEVYSTSDHCWRGLCNKPLDRCFVQSYLVIETMAYFTTSNMVVMSFDLNAEIWSTVFDPYGVLALSFHYVPPHPTFVAQTQVVGNKIFGLLKRDWNLFFDICASWSLNPNEDFFLRPHLAPDDQFLNDVFSVPPEFATDLSEDWSPTPYIFTWDKSEEIMCVVCYANDMPSNPFKLSNYASLTFFKIADGYCQSPINIKTAGYWDGREYSYAREKDHVNYFKAEFCRRTKLFIKTKKLFTRGIPCKCIFV